MVLQRDCNFWKQCITEGCWRASHALCWHSMEQVESLGRVPCMADTCDQDVPQWCREGLAGGALPSYCSGWHICCTAGWRTQVSSLKPLCGTSNFGKLSPNFIQTSMTYSWIPLRLCWHSCCVVAYRYKPSAPFLEFLQALLARWREGIRAHWSSGVEPDGFPPIILEWQAIWDSTGLSFTCFLGQFVFGFIFAPVKAPYTHFVKWQHSFLQSEEGAKQKAYWSLPQCSTRSTDIVDFVISKRSSLEVQVDH